MGLQDQIKKDLAAAMKAKDEEKKSVLRVIMGEFGRQSQKEISDPDVVKIIKKLVKAEKEVLEKSGQDGDNRFIQVAQGYLPQAATEEEIKDWIAANVDLEAYKIKMQAMGPIMKHFGDRADGNQVKQILAGL
jgi:uncharacterized protein YqeY